MALSNQKDLGDIKIDQVFGIYGPEGTGKTVIASTFPKSNKMPLLYLDIQEGGTGTIPREYASMVKVIEIEDFKDLDDTLTEILMLGPGHYSTIVLDSGTTIEELMKDYVKSESGKAKMNLGLWGETKELHSALYTMARKLYKVTGAVVVIIFHVREAKDEEHPEYARLVPSIQPGAQKLLAAKLSYLWYTDIEYVDVLNTATNEIERTRKFFAIIDAEPYLSTKCRKPPKYTGKIPSKIYNISYDKFKKQVLDLLKVEVPKA